MKKSIASASPRTWNQKNLPSNIERFEETPGVAREIIEELPSAARGFARRHRTIVLVSLALLGTLGLVWYLGKSD